MNGVIGAICAYTVFFLWVPLVFTDIFLPYLLAWAVGASAMSLLQRGPLPLVPLSFAGSLAGIAYLHYPSLPLITAAGLCAGAAITYLLRAARNNRALGYGIGMGAMAVMLLRYLMPHSPVDYISLFVSMLPLLWALALPALRSRPEGGWQDREDQPRWGYVSLMVFSICLIAGVYQHSIFFELSVIGLPHHFVLFLSLSSGALIMGHLDREKGIRISYAQPFILAFPLSLALFGFKASTVTYMFSDALIGFGLGGAAVFILSFIRDYGSLQRAVCLGVAGLGCIAGNSLADIFRRFYGIDLEGLVFISIIMFVAGTVPAMLITGTRRALEPAIPGEESLAPEGPLASQSEAQAAPEPQPAPIPQTAPAPQAEDEGTPIQTFCDAHNLSKRESEVLDVLLKGMTTREMAEVIFVSESTIKTHVRHIYTKSGVRNKVELLKKIQSI